MKILVATGRLAQNIVRAAVGENADVLVLDIDVAAVKATAATVVSAF